MASSQTDVMLKVIDALEGSNSPYLIAGSYASSTHGIARATMDIDILAALPAKEAAAFAARLVPEFYADEHAIKQAIMEKRSFNVIHLETGFKVDVFVSQRDEFDVKQLERKTLRTISREPERTVYVASPEDTVLSKLRWFRKTNETSERQWNDVLGVLTVKADELDLDYLRKWSLELGVSDLLDRAISQSRGELS